MIAPQKVKGIKPIAALSTAMRTICIIIVSASLFLLSHSGMAQESSANLLMDVRWVGIGMASPQGNHLYLRVHRDGRVEYEDGRMNAARSRFFVRTERISPSEINSLSEFLGTSGVKSLAREYPPVVTPLDHYIVVTVLLPRGKKSQTIKIVNFFPTSPKGSEAYPAALIQLLCRIERLRTSASFGITADRTQWCKP